MRRLFALSFVLAFAATACASSKDTGFPDPSLVPTDAGHGTCADATDTPEPYEDIVYVLDPTCFLPQVVTVAAGTTVHWEQIGGAPHSVTADDGTFDSHPTCKQDPSTCMQDGDAFDHTFADAGEFAYYCVIHGGPSGEGMAGTVIVEA